MECGRRLVWHLHPADALHLSTGPSAAKCAGTHIIPALKCSKYKFILHSYIFGWPKRQERVVLCNDDRGLWLVSGIVVLETLLPAL